MTETGITVPIEAEKEMNHQGEEMIVIDIKEIITGIIVIIIGTIEIVGIDVIDAVSFHYTISLSFENLKTVLICLCLLSDDDRDRKDRRHHSRSRSSSRR